MNTICVRTKDQFETILHHKLTMSWKCNQKRLNKQELIRIYNWGTNSFINSEIRQVIPDPHTPGRFIIYFRNPRIEKGYLKFYQNPVRYI